MGKDQKEKESGIKIDNCTCAHDYQDAKYGKGKRVWNKSGSVTATKWRCTVCSRVL